MVHPLVKSEFAARFVLPVAALALALTLALPRHAPAQGLKLDTATEKEADLYDRPNPHFELECTECHGAEAGRGRDVGDREVRQRRRGERQALLHLPRPVRQHPPDRRRPDQGHAAGAGCPPISRSRRSASTRARWSARPAISSTPRPPASSCCAASPSPRSPRTSPRPSSPTAASSARPATARSCARRARTRGRSPPTRRPSRPAPSATPRSPRRASRSSSRRARSSCATSATPPPRAGTSCSSTPSPTRGSPSRSRPRRCRCTRASTPASPATTRTAAPARRSSSARSSWPSRCSRAGCARTS